MVSVECADFSEGVEPGGEIAFVGFRVGVGFVQPSLTWPPSAACPLPRQGERLFPLQPGFEMLALGGGGVVRDFQLPLVFRFFG